MANDIRPEAQHQRAQDAISGGTITVAQPYLVMGGSGRWEINTTGPAGAYWDLSGGRYVVNSAAAAHDAYFKKVGTRYQVK